VTVLGIETSCDDTSSAVFSTEAGLVSSLISSQLEHKEFGGVVPEIASRAHLTLILPIIERALHDAEITLDNIDGVAVTAGPGLVGSLLVGVSVAKGIALARNIPMIGVHHIEGHITSNFLTTNIPSYPLIVLVVSGGHTELILMEAPLTYTVLGRTRDDAAGEAFDKVAKLLGLGYPGGPAIEKTARDGDSTFINFPVSSVPDFEFSFSGLKTAVLVYVKEKGENYVNEHLNDICASFQRAVIEALVMKTVRAMSKFGVSTLLLAGGVAANSILREHLTKASGDKGFTFYAPPPIFCTDNAAMIAKAGHDRLMKGMASPLTLSPEPHLPL
jgi:N6-L-threonylcarbamoyladenine synthase